MISRTFYIHYRAVTEAVATTATIGTALLLGYLILWAKL